MNINELISADRTDAELTGWLMADSKWNKTVVMRFDPNPAYCTPTEAQTYYKLLAMAKQIPDEITDTGSFAIAKEYVSSIISGDSYWKE